MIFDFNKTTILNKSYGNLIFLVDNLRIIYSNAHALEGLHITRANNKHLLSSIIVRLQAGLIHPQHCKALRCKVQFLLNSCLLIQLTVEGSKL